MAHQRRKSSPCANKRLPGDLFPILLDKLNQLQMQDPTIRVKHLLKEIDSKFVSSETDPAAVRRQRAIFKWLLTERENEATNERLLLTHEEYNILPRVTFGDFVSRCRDTIIGIIGETPPVDALVGAFSGGASTSRNRTSSHPAWKYLGKAHVTERALPWFDLLKEEAPGWLSGGPYNDLVVVPGNVMFTVPKKTDIDRVACKEPDINMFLQKGIGDYIRKNLRRHVNINLNDQSINRSFAREGSITNQLATLDLSSASDSVSTGLVQLLLPECWHVLLDDVRSPVTIIDGEEHRNQMFSSMGNGFTFELESLLFYTIARTTAYFRGIPGVVSIYGDDIICPSEVADDLTWTLQWFGFQVNDKKSFVTGPFRESCGGHYYNGFDITPFYVKEPITDLLSVIEVANKLRRWSEVPGIGICDPLVEPIWLWLKGYVPRCLWGGEDTSSKFQLVSQDTPHLILRQEDESKDTGTGGYFHWLNAAWDRSLTIQKYPNDAIGYHLEYEGISTSRYTKDRSKFRLRKVKSATVPRLPAVFLSELG